MAANKFKYNGNNSVYETTEILVVGDYAATKGQVLPISQEVLATLGAFDLTQSTDEISATKVGDDPDALAELIEEETEEDFQRSEVKFPDPPAASPPESNLNDASTGSGVAK